VLVFADPPARLVLDDVDELLQWLVDTCVVWLVSWFPFVAELFVFVFAWCWKRTLRRACVVEEVCAFAPLGSDLMTTLLLDLLALLLLLLRL